MKSIEQQETYNTARCRFMKALLFRYLHRDIDINKKSFIMDIYGDIPIGAVVVPFAIGDTKEWYIGWYRGKDEKGYDLVESIETHKICRFTNCGFLYLEDEDFTDNPWFRYSDRQYAMISTIIKRIAKISSWYSIGAPTFGGDNSIELPIRSSFFENYCTRKYRNLKAITIDALREHCKEVDNTKENKI